MRSPDLPSTSTRSRAAIRGHPLHPMVLPFPLVFLTSVLVTDLIFLTNTDPFWARSGIYLLTAGLVTGVLAALLGAIDFASIKQARAHTVGWLHSIGNAIALIIAAVNLLLRWEEPSLSIAPSGVILSLLTALLLALTGWAGGEMAYRHKVGVDDRS